MKDFSVFVCVRVCVCVSPSTHTHTDCRHEAEVTEKDTLKCLGNRLRVMKGTVERDRRESRERERERVFSEFGKDFGLFDNE